MKKFLLKITFLQVIFKFNSLRNSSFNCMLRQFVLSLSNGYQTVGRDHCCNRMNKVKKLPQTECNKNVYYVGQE